MKKPLFTKVLQVAMVVKSVDETVRTYYDKYGIGPWNIYEFNPENVEDMKLNGIRADYKMRIGLATIGETRIELMEPIDDKAIYASWLKEHGEGLHHVAYEVRDHDEIRKIITENNRITVIQEGKWLGIHQYTYFDTEKDLKHISEIYKSVPDFFKYEIDKHGHRRILFPKPLYTYPPEE